ncbi:hypothetical protein, partial [Paenibacillus sp. OT2-17]|uniref:hypothetical protein n=1 Tax=Paenibacillus sp. OT2-17 TaxID=2691605 RepID=UPI001F25F280
ELSAPNIKLATSLITDQSPGKSKNLLDHPGGLPSSHEQWISCDYLILATTTSTKTYIISILLGTPQSSIIETNSIHQQKVAPAGNAGATYFHLAHICIQTYNFVYKSVGV